MEAITLEQAAYISETVAAVAVLITLIYLGMQVRQNTRAVCLNTIHGISEAFRAQYALVGGHVSVADVYVKGLTQPHELATPEAVQFYALMHNQVRGYENAYYQYTEGALDGRYWAGMQGQMFDTSGMPGFIRYWGDRANWYSDEFRRHVDSVLIPQATTMTAGGGVYGSRMDSAQD